MTHDTIQRKLAFHGALLFGLAMLTGLYSGLALSDKIKLEIPHLALAAHVNGVLGGLWLIAFAWTLPMLGYSDVGKKRLASLMLVPTYGNWIVTILASLLGRRGIELGGDAKNMTIAGLLQVFVVLPTLVACGAWAWGFRRGDAR